MASFLREAERKKFGSKEREREEERNLYSELHTMDQVFYMHNFIKSSRNALCYHSHFTDADTDLIERLRNKLAGRSD